jgi:hypothetical protein
MKTKNPILQSTLHLTRSWLALPALALALAAGSSNLGATDFVSFQDGSWLDPVNPPWIPSGIPGDGDNVTITNNIQFASSSFVSVTVSNLSLNGGTLSFWGNGTLTMAGPDSRFTGNNLLTGNGGVLHNHGTVFQSSAGTLNLGYATTFENQLGGSYNLEGDGGFSSGGNSAFNNSGLLRKSGGNGTSIFSSVYLNNLNGVIEVDSGTLSLAGGGSSSNGTFIVSSGAVLDLTAGSSPTWAGLISGSGAGIVSFSSGTINSSPSLTLNLPGGFFQWTGGRFTGTTINLNMVTIAGSGSVTVNDWGAFYNSGVVHHTNTATLNIGYGAAFANQAGGSYDLEGDGGFSSGIGNAAFNNSGLLRKSGGNGISSFGINSGVAVNNLNGLIEVDSGTLSLAGGGSSSNGTFIVSSGAVLDLSGGTSPTWAGLVSGSGAGTVSFNSGTINSSPSLTLNLPGGLFQWTGGRFTGTTINSNVVTIAGSGSVTVSDWCAFYNSGVVHHTNAATLNIGYARPSRTRRAAAIIWKVTADFPAASGMLPSTTPACCAKAAAMESLALASTVGLPLTT